VSCHPSPERFRGNQTQAARYLDISRRTLIYRMEKHGSLRIHSQGQSKLAIQGVIFNCEVRFDTKWGTLADGHSPPQTLNSVK